MLCRNRPTLSLDHFFKVLLNYSSSCQSTFRKNQSRARVLESHQFLCLQSWCLVLDISQIQDFIKSLVYLSQALNCCRNLVAVQSCKKCSLQIFYWRCSSLAGSVWMEGYYSVRVQTKDFQRNWFFFKEFLQNSNATRRGQRQGGEGERHMKNSSFCSN